jgi:3-hydroxyacyl-[acyl-carrier-protein] dehydratase
MTITSLTPHGPEFSFVDACDVFAAEKRALGSKWLNPKSPFFAGHFPGQPLMPGVLLVECAAQTAGILWHVLGKEQTKTPLYLAQLLAFKFKKAARPGETVHIEVILEKELGALAQFGAILWVGHDAMVAQGNFVLGRELVPVTPSA